MLNHKTLNLSIWHCNEIANQQKKDSQKIMEQNFRALPYLDQKYSKLNLNVILKNPDDLSWIYNSLIHNQVSKIANFHDFRSWKKLSIYWSSRRRQQRKGKEEFLCVIENFEFLTKFNGNLEEI